MHCLPTTISIPSPWCVCGRSCWRWWESDIQTLYNQWRLQQSPLILVLGKYIVSVLCAFSVFSTADFEFCLGIYYIYGLEGTTKI